MLNSTPKNLLVYVAFLFYLSGCGESGGSSSSGLGNTPAPSAPTLSLNSNFTNVNSNDSVTLNWSSSEVDTCIASGDWSGNKSTLGSQTINALQSDSTFHLRCEGPAGEINDSVTITIANTAVTTVTLSANPANILVNGSTILNWSTNNADTCTASGDWSGSKSTSGSQTINSLMADSTFVLNCTGAGGTVSDSVNVTVTTPTAPTVSLSASPSSVQSNGSTTLSWSSSNADSCTASGDWSGSMSTSGSQNISSITADSTFILNCTGAGGSKSDSVTVIVTAAAPTVSLSASPTSVATNGSTTLSWTSTNANSCTASGDWSGSKSTSGSQTISSLTVDSTFTLNCAGSGGNVNDSVNVSVVLNNNGTALLSWTPPTLNSDGSALTDLNGYKIYYGTAPGNYSDSVTINNPGLTSYLIEGLAQATWYFAMRSINASNTESLLSGEVSKVIN